MNDLSIIQQINEPIIIFDKNLNIYFINDYAENILQIQDKKRSLKNIFNNNTVEVIKKSSSLFLNKNNIYKIEIISNSSRIILKIKTSKIMINNVSYDFSILEDRSSSHVDQTLNNCIFKISESSHYVDDLDELYEIIHDILSDVIYTNNFYIALIDNKNNLIHFPYFVDEYDSRPDSKEIGNGLTEYVIKTGESILVNPEQFKKFKKTKTFDIQGKKCIDWLGVPLKINSNEAIGVIVIQSYDKNIRFNEEEQRILTFVSDQIAMAIKRKMDTLEIEKKAYYDQLTGLTNRLLFHDRLEQGIFSANRNNKILAVLFIDLDNFKYVNDSMGHTSGDTLLRLVSRRLIKCLRKTDTVARWGGDEFTILLTNIKNIRDISILCNRILNKEFTNIVVDNQELRITASIGVSIYPQDGNDVEELIKNADTAMYKAKELGKNQYQFFKSKMNADVINRVQSENNLYRAIEKEEFLLLYQPQIDLSNSKIIGFESLIRWDTPDKGVLAPYKFIPIAEETNLIIPLGQWIIEQTCIQNKKWHDQGYKLTSAVNISAKQFLQSDLAEVIIKVLDKTKLDPQYLELELTETILIDNVDKTIQILNKLKDMGVKISIDDFGTGYSSLSYLKKFPIDTLKIDQSFISPIKDRNSINNIAIANIVIDLGHKLGMKVIAEGVETQEQVEFLKEYACDKIQGYIISEPVNEIEFNLLLKKQY